MSVGMLTGRPEEEMPGSASDLLQELSQLHEQVRQVMQGIAQASWPSASLPGGMGELVEILEGARRRFQLWKISACRQGAREAWAMVISGLQTEHNRRSDKAFTPHPTAVA